jgi:hypothetical protein
MSEYEFSPVNGSIIRTGFKLSMVCIIESLPDSDRKTGRELYEDVLSIEKIKDPSLTIKYYDVDNKQDLFNRLHLISRYIRCTGKIPLIHFETHGHKDFLQVKSGENINYDELLSNLRPINILTQNNLFIVVAACYGGYMPYTLHKFLLERCPFFGILGPMERLSAVEIIKGYTAFYQELLNTNDINSAVKKLKEAISSKVVEYYAIPSEYLFMKAFKNYIEIQCSKENAEKRAEKIVKEVKCTLGKDIDINQTVELICSPENIFKDYERIKNRFFMRDMFPNAHWLPNPMLDDVMSS